MEKEKVIELHTRDAVRFKAQVTSTLTLDKDGAVMETSPLGVRIAYRNLIYTVPYANIVFMRHPDPVATLQAQPAGAKK